jgi:exonuclease III
LYILLTGYPFYKRTRAIYIQTQWGFKCIFSSYKSNSRGVAILFNNNFEYKLHNVKTDALGNYLLLDLTIEGERITLVNIYGPNNDNPNFYENILEKIEEFENEKYILCGDFNLALNQSLDTNNYMHINNPKARDKILENFEKYSFRDPFRELHPQLKKYTWVKKNPFKQARLDFYLLSDNLMQFVDTVKIDSSYRSDHSGVVLNLKLHHFINGKGLWKFNNSLLKDKTYIQTIKETILNIKCQYAIPLYNLENINNILNEEIMFTINDQLFLEVLLMEIRGRTISYSAYKKKVENVKEKSLIEEIQALEEDECTTNSELLEEKRNELIEIRQTKLKGHFIRSRAKWVEEGEKPTKYFCNMESRNFYNKLISRLELETGSIITDQKQILEETKAFYQKLYSKSNQPNNENIQYIFNINANKLTDSEAQELEGEISYLEAFTFLKSMKNDKSPGSDGFSAEFLKIFWKDLGHFIVRSINYGYNINEMSSSQKLGIITCIPKPNKPKYFLKNWRPITLLNCIYKIASGCIANRIKKVLDKIISKDQTGFIKGRFIAENIRLIYDIMQYTEQHQIPGLLFLVDFEKAFDSVSWTFVEQALEFFNFKISIKTWIKTFYNNSESRILQNGFLSETFKLERGCRQGDPLSPYIFIICAEILAILIRNSKDIDGININGQEYLISQYADDTSFILDGTYKSLDSTLKLLELYANVSGLKINYSKSKIIWIGSKKYSKDVFHHPKWKLEWGTETFSLLGVHFSVNIDQIIQANFEPKLMEMEKMIKQRSTRTLTPLGRIVVIKTLII